MNFLLNLYSPVLHNSKKQHRDMYEVYLKLCLVRISFSMSSRILSPGGTNLKIFCKLPDHIGYSFNVLLIPDVNQVFILFYVLP